MNASLKDIASHFSELASNHEEDFERALTECTALRKEVDALQIDLSAERRENDLLRTMVLEASERADRLQRLYYSVVTEFRVVDTIIRDSLAKAREAAKDFKLNEARGAPQVASEAGAAAVEGALASAVREAGKAATEASMGHADNRPVPGFLTAGPKAQQGMKDLVAKINK